MTMEPVLNPFNYGEATKIIDENRKPSDWWQDYLALSEVFDENEFYILFSDGLLVKKGRSKMTSSNYIRGEKFKSFKQNYEKT